MALSNWDTYALNLKGEPSDGTFTSPAGISVEFYKNWLYVHDPRAWHEGLGFVKPVIMEVNHGQLRYGDVNVVSARGPQNGIYAAVWSGWESAKEPEQQLRGMVGIGCSGFRDVLEVIEQKHPEEFAKIDPKYLDPDKYFTGQYSSYGPQGEKSWGCNFFTDNGEFHEIDFSHIPEPDLEELWVGVRADSVEFLRGQLAEWDIPKPLATLDVRAGRRFNQGDAFFEAAGVAPLTATKVGEAEEPLLTQAFKASKE
jgi:hypothetical protein